MAIPNRLFRAVYSVDNVFYYERGINMNKIKKKKFKLPISEMVGVPSEIELNIMEDDKEKKEEEGGYLFREDGGYGTEMIKKYKAYKKSIQKEVT